MTNTINGASKYAHELDKMIVQESKTGFFGFTLTVPLCSAEPESFEAFVPKGWQGEYRDLMMEIPRTQRYWIDKNGKNIIGG